MTVYATEASMNTIKDDSGFAYKSDVISSHWTAHLRHSHQDAISIQVQCEAMAVLEYWHYSVFDPEKNLCYFGIISMDSFIAYTQAEGEGELPPPAGSSTSEAPPANGEGEFKPFVVDDTTSRQVQINTAELGFFPVDFFTERPEKKFSLSLSDRQGRKWPKDYITSTSHKALLEMADVAEVLAVNLRKTFCFFLYSSMVKNFSCSAWKRRTTSPPLRTLSIFSLCSRKREIFHEV